MGGRHLTEWENGMVDATIDAALRHPGQAYLIPAFPGGVERTRQAVLRHAARRGILVNTRLDRAGVGVLVEKAQVKGSPQGT